jgi:flagellar biosynthesis protein FlhF
MKIKSYFARTVEDAITAARQELGPDAMLVNSRKAGPEAAADGEYEVVFAADTPGAAERIVGRGAPVKGVQLPEDRLSSEVAELKNQLESMRRTLSRAAFGPSEWMASPPDISEAYAALTSNDVDSELAREIVHAAAFKAEELRAPGQQPDSAPQPSELARGGARPRHGLDRAAFQRALFEELQSRITAEPQLGMPDSRPRIVALVGPPGSGKTTTLVKLAVNYGLACRRPSLLLSTDTYRVAAAEQLRSYAAILGIGFRVLETVTALSQAIEENRSKDLIFIDTPGFSLGDLDETPVLARFLASRSDIETHLVLTSSMKSADLIRMGESFETFQPRKLLFTRLDETASFGAIANLAVKTRKPLSFFGKGQRIPEDLETATVSRVVEMILGRRAECAAA